jgi:hypothetical protein
LLPADSQNQQTDRLFASSWFSNKSASCTESHTRTTNFFPSKWQPDSWAVSCHMMTKVMPRFQVHSWPLPSSTNYISSLLHHTVELVITTHITYQGCILTSVSIIKS